MVILCSGYIFFFVRHGIVIAELSELVRAFDHFLVVSDSYIVQTTLGLLESGRVIPPFGEFSTVPDMLADAVHQSWFVDAANVLNVTNA